MLSYWAAAWENSPTALELRTDHGSPTSQMTVSMQYRTEFPAVELNSLSTPPQGGIALMQPQIFLREVVRMCETPIAHQWPATSPGPRAKSLPAWDRRSWLRKRRVGDGRWQRVKSIADRARELPATEHDACVVRETDDDLKPGRVAATIQ